MRTINRACCIVLLTALLPFSGLAQTKKRIKKHKTSRRSVPTGNRTTFPPPVVIEPDIAACLNNEAAFAEKDAQAAASPDSIPTARKIYRGGLLCGKAVSLPKPAYPAKAKAARISGVVIIEIIAGEDGRMQAARAIKGPPELYEASLRAACRARFAPLVIQGQAVRTSGVINYNFVADDTPPLP